jgi:hypothetical protein
MNLSKNIKKLLIDELNFVLQSMKATDKPKEKLYFFSAIYAVANRIFNIEFHSELVFIHNVFQAAYNEINANLTAVLQGQGIAIGIPGEVFDGLEVAIEETITIISKDQNIYPTLQRISELAYSTTGNGRYLHFKGVLTI